MVATTEAQFVLAVLQKCNLHLFQSVFTDLNEFSLLKIPFEEPRVTSMYTNYG